MSLRAEVDGAIGRVTLDRPSAMNAITVELAEGLEHAVAELAGVCRVIVIRGAGGNFCVGGDFDELQRLRAEGPDATASLFAAFARATDLVGRVEVPVVAAVEGYAMAGGFELMQACDIAIVAADATLADNHANFAMVPGGGGSQRLPRLVGRQRAEAHILLGDRIDGSTAEQWGLAYAAPDPSRFEGVVEDVLRRLADKSQASLAAIKRLVREGLERPLAEGLAWEHETVVAHVGGQDGGAGIASFHRRRS